MSFPESKDEFDSVLDFSSTFGQRGLTKSVGAASKRCVRNQIVGWAARSVTTGDLIAAPKVGVDQVTPEIGMIESIESIQPELHSQLFQRLEVLVQREIKVHVVRTEAGAAGSISDGAHSKSGEGESCRIENLIAISAGSARHTRNNVGT